MVVKRDYPERPIVGVGAVIVDAEGGRALIVRRASEPRKGEWSIPGGVLEVGEKLREGVVREALEETGLRVEAGEVLQVFDSIIADSAGRTQYHFVLIDFICKMVGGELRAGSDVSEVRWISAAELDDFPLAEPAAQVIGKALSKICGD